MSAGSRSLVNCTRCQASPSTCASACASVVLPTPGTSSMSRWPRASRQVSARRTALGLAEDDAIEGGEDGGQRGVRGGHGPTISRRRLVSSQAPPRRRTLSSCWREAGVLRFELRHARAIGRDHVRRRIAHEIFIAELRLEFAQVRVVLRDALVQTLDLGFRVDESGHGHEQRELAEDGGRGLPARHRRLERLHRLESRKSREICEMLSTSARLARRRVLQQQRNLA